MSELIKRVLTFLLCTALLPGMMFPAFAVKTEYRTDVYLQSTINITKVSNDTAVPVGGGAVLAVAAEGDGLIYSWEVSADGGSTWAPADGTNDSASYSIENAQLNTPETMPYLYRVTATDSLGGTASELIRVLVHDEYEYVTMDDSVSGVKVTGFLHETAQLAVELVQSETTAATLQQMVRPGYAPLAAYEVYLRAPDGAAVSAYAGRLDIVFTVDGIYNGSRLNVYHQKSSGLIETLTGTVVSNQLSVTTEELSPFLIEAAESTLLSVTVTSGAGGDVSPSGRVYAAAGTDKTFVFTPHTGYVLDTVRVDGNPVSVSGNRYTLTNILENHTLHATFKRPSLPHSKDGDDDPDYTITIPATENGRTSPTGKITRNYGDSLTIYFYPAEGYVVGQVLINGTEVSPGSNSYTFTVTGNTTVNVSFQKKTSALPIVTRTITASAGSHGRVSPAGATTVNDGGDLYVYFFPDDGYEVSGVTVDGVGVDAGSYWHFINIRADHTIHATFQATETAPAIGPAIPGDTQSGTPAANLSGNSPVPPPASRDPVTANPPSEIKEPEHSVITIQIDGEAHGTVSPSGEIIVEPNGSQTIYFYPEEGYVIGKVLVDSTEVDAFAGYYTMENVAAGSHTITVIFQPADAAARPAYLFPRFWLIPLLILLAAAGFVIWRKTKKQR